MPQWQYKTVIWVSVVFKRRKAVLYYTILSRKYFTGEKKKQLQRR